MDVQKKTGTETCNTIDYKRKSSHLSVILYRKIKTPSIGHEYDFVSYTWCKRLEKNGPIRGSSCVQTCLPT